jgi:hypothetical protein
MALPSPFDESTTILYGPQGKDDPDVQPVHCRILDGTVVTCWQLEADEIDAIIASNGKVWVSVWGRSMPPMMVTARKEDVI